MTLVSRAAAIDPNRTLLTTSCHPLSLSLVHPSPHLKQISESGGMKGLAFIKDPDGYWIEILTHDPEQKEEEVDCCDVRIDNGGGYSGGGGGEKT